MPKLDDLFVDLAENLLSFLQVRDICFIRSINRHFGVVAVRTILHRIQQNRQKQQQHSLLENGTNNDNDEERGECNMFTFNIPCSQSAIRSMYPLWNNDRFWQQYSLFRVVQDIIICYGENGRSKNADDSDEDDSDESGNEDNHANAKTTTKKAKQIQRPSSPKTIFSGNMDLPDTKGDGQFDLQHILTACEHAKKMLSISEPATTTTSGESSSLLALPLNSFQLHRCQRVIDVLPLAQTTLPIREICILNCCLVYNTDRLVEYKRSGQLNAHLELKNIVLPGHLHARPNNPNNVGEEDDEEEEEEEEEVEDGNEIPFRGCTCEWHSQYPITRFQQHVIDNFRNVGYDSEPSNEVPTQDTTSSHEMIYDQFPAIKKLKIKLSPEVIQQLMIMTIMRLTYIKQIRPCSEYCHEDRDMTFSDKSICAYHTNVHYNSFRIIEMIEIPNGGLDVIDADTRPLESKVAKKKSKIYVGKRKSKKRRDIHNEIRVKLNGPNHHLYRVKVLVDAVTVYDYVHGGERSGDGEMVFYFNHEQIERADDHDHDDDNDFNNRSNKQRNIMGIWKWKGSGFMRNTCGSCCRTKLPRYWDHFLCLTCEEGRC